MCNSVRICAKQTARMLMIIQPSRTCRQGFARTVFVSRAEHSHKRVAILTNMIVSLLIKIPVGILMQNILTDFFS